MQTQDEDRGAEAATILGESEGRIADASMPERPTDVVREHRRSEDTST